MRLALGETPLGGTKADQIYGQLRRELIHGEWPFGQVFSSYELAERFGVSRRPVLDAIHRLGSDGFVEVIPQVGCRVVLPTKDGLRDHLELSAVLQGPATSKAATRATEEQVQVLEEIQTRLVPVARKQDMDAFQSIHREFHAAILAIAGNRAVASLADRSSDLWEFYFHPYRHDVSLSVLEQRAAEHVAIIAAIRDGDGPRAQASMDEHLNPAHILDLIDAFQLPGDTPQGDRETTGD